jgi:hypothetical protein
MEATQVEAIFEEVAIEIGPDFYRSTRNATAL